MALSRATYCAFVILFVAVASPLSRLVDCHSVFEQFAGMPIAAVDADDGAAVDTGDDSTLKIASSSCCPAGLKLMHNVVVCDGPCCDSLTEVSSARSPYLGEIVWCQTQNNKGATGPGRRVENKSKSNGKLKQSKLSLQNVFGGKQLDVSYHHRPHAEDDVAASLPLPRAEEAFDVVDALQQKN